MTRVRVSRGGILTFEERPRLRAHLENLVKYVYVRVSYPEGSVILRGTTRREIWGWLQHSSLYPWGRIEWMKRAPAPQECLGGRRPRKPRVYRGDCIIAAMQRPDGSYV